MSLITFPYRLYRNPEEIDAENAAAAKLDRATAQRRSAIRREPSIRPRRDQTAMSSTLNEIVRHGQDIRRMHRQLNIENIRTDAEIAELENELQRLRRQRERAMDRMERLRAHTEAENTLSSSRPSTAPRNTTTPEDPTQTLSQSSLLETESSSQILLPRPARESNLRFEVAATHPASPAPENTMPSPPRSVSDTGRSRPVDGPLDNWDTVPNLSHDFAPARRAQVALDRANATIAAARQSMQDTSSGEQAGLETPPPESWEGSYPPLRRVPHMSPRPLPRSPVDGLGNRNRSPSPISESQEESTWNNLLSTMDTSNEALSTSTSFTSMTDLLSFSRSSSYRSSNTQNTSTSFGEIGSSSEETCELPPGITEEDVRMIRERHRRTARRLPRRRISQRDVESPALDTDYSLLEAGSYAGAESEMSRLLMDHVAQRLRQNGETESEGSPSVHAFHDILDRMQRREFIPDEVWAVAGLSPDFFNRT